MSSIPFGKPMIGEAERKAVAEILAGSTLVHGPATHAFEKAFAARAGARHAISVGSCTAGLHLSLLVHGIKAGDSVIVPAMTHVATAHAVEYCGARPVFVDVEPESGNIDPDGVERALAETGAKAVMVVHYLGLPCAMDRINAAARCAGAVVIEDCALALDAIFDGRKAGTLGATGCFSFYPTKHMTTIEGGMVTTDDDGLAAEIAQRKAFGYDRTIDKRTKPGLYDVTLLGFNYRMNEVEAAVGLAQLARMDEFQRRRAENHRIIADGLAALPEVTVFATSRGAARSSHFCLNAVLPADGRLDRDKITASLKEDGIGTSIHYPEAVPLMTYYRDKYGYGTGMFPVAEWLARQSISLPVGPHVEAIDAERIARAFVAAATKP
jgi:perosamine synthetase